MTLKLDGKAENGGNLLFHFELEFAGVFRIQNVPQESLNAVVLIECPRLLFPFAREIIATTVRNGGFPPLLLDPVDFVGLYRQKMSEMQGGRARRARIAERADSASGVRSRASIIPPQRILAQRRHEFAVRRAIGIADARRQRHAALAPHHDAVAACCRGASPLSARPSCAWRAPISSR